MSGARSDMGRPVRTPRNPKQQLVMRLHEAGLNSDRFVDVENGQKACHNHTNQKPDKISGNIGLYAGNGLVLEDDDDYRGDADKSDRPDLPSTFVIETPHGGRLRLFAYDGDAAEVVEQAHGRAKNPGLPWGELRVHNQYSVVPPSQLNGCDKEWCEECVKDEGGLYEIVGNRPIATIDTDQLIALAKTAKTASDKTCPKYNGGTSAESNDARSASREQLPKFNHDPDARETLTQAIHEFQNATDTSQRAMDYLMDLVKGRYGKCGHTGDHSGAEVDLASKLFGILQYAGIAGNERQLIYSYITISCIKSRFADDGEVRKWIRRSDRYQIDSVIRDAIDTFNPELWERWRTKGDDGQEWTGDYSSITLRCVFRALHSTYEGRPGYPTKREVVSAAQGIDPSRSTRTHEEALRDLRVDHGQVKMAYLGGNDYVYYPASKSAPPNAEWVSIMGERKRPRN